MRLQWTSNIYTFVYAFVIEREGIKYAEKQRYLRN